MNCATLYQVHVFPKLLEDHKHHKQSFLTALESKKLTNLPLFGTPEEEVVTCVGAGAGAGAGVGVGVGVGVGPGAEVEAAPVESKFF